MDKKEVGIYIHIPFCARKCYYCDFVSYENKTDLVKNYVTALKREIKIKGKENNFAEITTIYIGGGTPSFVEACYIEDIIKTIKEIYNIKKDAEITIEVNPGTVTLEKLEKYKRIGINRLSIGLQSTNNNLLKEIGRIHTYEEFIESYTLARKVGFQNINVDLMLALPNQTIQNLQDSIEKVITINPEHISVYSLILEEDTKLYDLVEYKKVQLLDDDVERKMYWKVKKILEQNGYNQYEISNFAKDGYNSKHNMNCWNQEEYIGFGVAAHSYIENIRYSNTQDIKQYIDVLLNEKRIKQDENIFSNNINTKKYLNVTDLKCDNIIKDIVIIHEKQNKLDKEKEYMLLGLRKIEGISIQKFKQKFIENPLYLFRKELDKLVKEELIEVENDNIKLTNKGLDFANLVWEEFV